MRRICLSFVVLAFLAGNLASAQSSSEIFVNVSKEAGIETAHRSTWDEFGNGVFTTGYLGIGQAWGDYDNDGWTDLYVIGGLSPSTLYHNNGDGTFSISEYATDVSLPNVWTGGAVWADYDNDGFKDLYVVAHGPNVLFHNEAGGGFSNATDLAGVGDSGKGSTAAWGDYDADGYLDLYVANWRCYPECPKEQAAALASDRLYHNLGDGTFADVSSLLGEKLQGSAFSVSFADYDNDGDPDIYVVNDKVEHPIGNVLWRNDGEGCGGWCWSDVSSETGTNAIRNGMGLAVGDYDNDLDLDFYFSDMGEPMALLQNLGDRFRNASTDAGVGTDVGDTVGWGTAFFDYNNDGWQDLFLATTGMADRFNNPTAPAGILLPHPSVFFENQGDGTFHDVTPASWEQFPKPSMTVAYADYDQDGFVDFVVGDFNLGYTLYRNAGLAGANNHWLTVRLEGRPPVNRDAIGARVLVTSYDGMTQMQEVKSGSSLGAGDDTALHFGLGGSSIKEIKVIWTNGKTEIFHGVPTNQIWHLVYSEREISN